MTWILSSLIFTVAAQAAPVDQIKNLKYSVKVKAKEPAAELEFSIPAGHHFNSEAPSRVIMRLKGKETLAKVAVTPSTVSAKFDKSFVKNDCQVTSELYVCDDANTYCVPKKQVFTCTGSLVAEPLGLMKPAEAVKEARNYFEKEIFLESPEEAFKLAKKTNRLVMIDFYGIWCPPCNMLDETVFSTSLFQKQKKFFVFLKLDADKAESWDWKSKYNIKGYPTIMFVNAQGEEISRIVGSRRATAFVTEMNKAWKSRYQPMSVKQKLADAEGHPKEAYEMGMIHLNREEFALAAFYLLKASRHWTASDPKRNDLLSAQLGWLQSMNDKDSQKVLARLYEESLKWYPHDVQAIDRAQKWADLARELQDDKMTEKAVKTSIDVATWFTLHPGSLKTEEMTLGDVYAFMAEAFDSLKDGAGAKANYKKAYAEYTRFIKAAGLDEKKERGVNLERIYCLWKSGEPEKAQILYSDLEKTYPSEFTFYYQHAHLLKDVKKYDEALDKALTAYKYSYGDNKLRVTSLLGELYDKTGKRADGLKLLNEVIDGFELPQDKNIRSHKYVERLKKLRDEMNKAEVPVPAPAAPAAPATAPATPVSTPTPKSAA